jgi:hypothetical protein
VQDGWGGYGGIDGEAGERDVERDICYGYGNLPPDPSVMNVVLLIQELMEGLTREAEAEGLSLNSLVEFTFVSFIEDKFWEKIDALGVLPKISLPKI